MKNAPGILLCFIIAVPAWFLGKAFPVIGSPVFGIMAGMLLSLVFPNLSGFRWRSVGLEEGIKITSKMLLQLSIILLGFGMNLFHVFIVGSQSILVILATLTVAFLTAYVVGKLLKLDGKVTTLIGVGTSICGGSAIAATAPVIKAGDEEVAHAISTIFLFNVLAVFIFPPLGRMLGLSDMGFGMWAGTAINDTSSVVAAGTAWSSSAGNDTALAFATIVKLTRTLMIVPITLILAIYNSGLKAPSAKSGDESHETSVTGSFNLFRVFPWFVIGFVAAAIVNTMWSLGAVSSALVIFGKFLIVMAMTAIGLNTNIKTLLSHGLKPILLGISCWIAVAVASLLVQSMIKLW